MPKLNGTPRARRRFTIYDHPCSDQIIRVLINLNHTVGRSVIAKSFTSHFSQIVSIEVETHNSLIPLGVYKSTVDLVFPKSESTMSHEVGWADINGLSFL